jgi:ribonuclease PH
MLRDAVGNNLAPHPLVVLLIDGFASGEGKLPPVLRQHVEARQVGFTPKLVAGQDGSKDCGTFHTHILAQVRNLSSDCPNLPDRQSVALATMQERWESSGTARMCRLLGHFRAMHETCSRSRRW